MFGGAGKVSHLVKFDSFLEFIEDIRVLADSLDDILLQSFLEERGCDKESFSQSIWDVKNNFWDNVQ